MRWLAGPCEIVATTFSIWSGQPRSPIINCDAGVFQRLLVWKILQTLKIKRRQKRVGRDKSVRRSTERGPWPRGYQPPARKAPDHITADLPAKDLAKLIAGDGLVGRNRGKNGRVGLTQIDLLICDIGSHPDDWPIGRARAQHPARADPGDFIGALRQGDPEILDQQIN